MQGKPKLRKLFRVIAPGALSALSWHATKALATKDRADRGLSRRAIVEPVEFDCTPTGVAAFLNGMDDAPVLVAKKGSPA